MTRAPFYPLADRTAQWFSTATGPQRTANRLVLWHTTEMGVPGEPWPAYTYGGQRGGSAPHWTVKPDRANRRLLWRQHWRADESARALANPPGGVETNNTGVLQIELGGTSVAGDPGYRWDQPDDWALEGLARFSVWAYTEWGIPLTDETRQWHALARNSSGYIIQAGGSTRLTGSQWLAARGHAGHQHAAENDHVDPGAFPADRMLTTARQLATGDDMSAQDVAAINAHIDQALRAQVTAILSANLGASGPNVGVALQSSYQLAQKIAAQTDTLEASEAAQTAALARVNPDALADAVVGKLSGSADAAVVKAAVVEALQENLPTTFVAQPPAAPTA